MRKSPFSKFTSFIILTAFLLNTICPLPIFAQELPWMPKPGVRVGLSPEFIPAHLTGLVIHPEDALKFDFLIDRGDKPMAANEKKEEYQNLIKYFLASLTIPDEDQWVNLSPYEKDRIIKDDFGKTEMGRDLLAQDYLLKQITSSLIYPEENLGKEFWNRVYERAWKEYGTTQIPVNTFNKVWIVPDEAAVYESGNTVYVLRNHLKVMLEQDYLSIKKHTVETPFMASLNRDAINRVSTNNVNSLGSNIVREIILPELEREVNEGKNFALLRQIYSGMILATWYKRTLKESLLGKVYDNKAKLKGLVIPAKAGIHNKDSDINIIYQQYLKAFKKGVFNYIKEDVDKYTQQPIPRKYFSGGTQGFFNVNPAMFTPQNRPPASLALSAANRSGSIDLAQIQLTEDIPKISPAQSPSDASMSVYNWDLLRQDPRTSIDIFLSQKIPGTSQTFGEKYKDIQSMSTNQRDKIDQEIAMAFFYAHFHSDMDDFLINDIQDVPGYLRPLVVDILKFSLHAYENDPYAQDARIMLWKLGELAFDEEVFRHVENYTQFYDFPLYNVIGHNSKLKDLYILDLASGPRAARYFSSIGDQKIIVEDSSFFVEGHLNRAKNFFKKGENIIIRRVDIRDIPKAMPEAQYRHIRWGNVHRYVNFQGKEKEFVTELRKKIAPGGTISFEYYNSDLRSNFAFLMTGSFWPMTEGTMEDTSGHIGNFMLFINDPILPEDILDTTQISLTHHFLLRKYVASLGQDSPITVADFDDIILKDQGSGFSQFYFKGNEMRGFLLSHFDINKNAVIISFVGAQAGFEDLLTKILLRKMAEKAKKMGIKRVISIANGPDEIYTPDDLLNQAMMSQETEGQVAALRQRLALLYSLRGHLIREWINDKEKGKDRMHQDTLSQIADLERQIADTKHTTEAQKEIKQGTQQILKPLTEANTYQSIVDIVLNGIRQTEKQLKDINAAMTAHSFEGLVEKLGNASKLLNSRRIKTSVNTKLGTGTITYTRRKMEYQSRFVKVTPMAEGVMLVKLINENGAETDMPLAVNSIKEIKYDNAMVSEVKKFIGRTFRTGVLGAVGIVPNVIPTTIPATLPSNTVFLAPKSVDLKHINDLIERLGADAFSDREAAQGELIRIGVPAIQPLQDRLSQKGIQPEISGRISTILANYGIQLADNPADTQKYLATLSKDDAKKGLFMIPIRSLFESIDFWGHGDHSDQGANFKAANELLAAQADQDAQVRGLLVEIATNGVVSSNNFNEMTDTDVLSARGFLEAIHMPFYFDPAKDSDVRLALASQMGHLSVMANDALSRVKENKEDVRKLLLSRLNDKNPRVRVQVVGALWFTRAKDPEAVKTYLGLLSDPDDDVVMEALYAMPNDPAIVDPLLIKLTDKNVHKKIRSQIIITLIQADAPQVVNKFANLMANADYRPEIMDALGKMGVPEAAQVLLKEYGDIKVRDPQDQQLLDIVRALDENPKYMGITRNWLIDPDKTINDLKTELNKEATSRPATMTSNPAMFTPAKGGIDFNSANLNLLIKRDGAGVPLPLALQDAASLSRIEGFFPVILEIKSAAGLPIFRELNNN